ncbi:MAG: phosphoglycerate dehydrogenase [Candidatus Saganbacteria bacterium]|nr:phosphoglycerate dehydrogenase [Candidatus Saganbacteria bacterium]
MKILISTSSFGNFDDSPIRTLESKGLEVVLNPYKRKLAVSESIELLNGVAGLIAGTEALTEDVLIKSKNLKVISRCGVGMDSVDLKTAQRLGIEVINTPDAPTQSVAELAIALIFSLLRHISVSDKNVKEGKWNKLMGNLLIGKTLGIIGYGRIGRRLCHLLSPFGLNIIAHDINEDSSAKFVSLDELFANADILTIHVSTSKCLIGKNELKKVKPTALMVNLSRGGVVDEDALFSALKEKRIAGAAVDVFSKEPYSGPLSEFDNVILTPHIGSYAKESRIEMEKQAVHNLIKAFEMKGVL